MIGFHKWQLEGKRHIFLILGHTTFLFSFEGHVPGKNTLVYLFQKAKAMKEIMLHSYIFLFSYHLNSTADSSNMAEFDSASYLVLKRTMLDFKKFSFHAF